MDLSDTEMDMDMDMDMDNSTSSTMDMSMSMYFSNSIYTTIVFDWWTTNSWGSYLGSLFIIVLLVVVFQFTRNFQQLFVYHWAFIIKEKRFRTKSRTSAITNPVADPNGAGPGAAGQEGGAEEAGRKPLIDNKQLDDRRMPFRVRCLYATIAGLNYGFSLFLMLIAMTYNVGCFLALVVGYILGDVLFASTPLSLADLTEVPGDHCG
eukprot:CAMPEP_0206391046 /NCGR_PEP_ID=MMETSP0294-20121207/19018_1 /ASSEMBLY_ACC=CAM_ASM_000327 /TAXON_ID=39354 /ORGANISM="Heterosigma akashiwo, Strain CCMP2393" /LENGTH=206 /DNA_ID=CAMNT_0053843635 /DNA_START=114 /DNA_END=734 /DNA_ORIENTATION=+